METRTAQASHCHHIIPWWWLQPRQPLTDLRPSNSRSIHLKQPATAAFAWLRPAGGRPSSRRSTRPRGWCAGTCCSRTCCGGARTPRPAPSARDSCSSIRYRSRDEASRAVDLATRWRRTPTILGLFRPCAPSGSTSAARRQRRFNPDPLGMRRARTVSNVRSAQPLSTRLRSQVRPRESPCLPPHRRLLQPGDGGRIRPGSKARRLLRRSRISTPRRAATARNVDAPPW